MKNPNIPPSAKTTALDSNGFNPNDYEWIPVAKRRRSDGWTPQCQRQFIEALADSGSVTTAAQACGMSRMACYKLRRSPGAERFAAAWDAAIEQASRQLIDIAFDRAINGVEDFILDREGNHIYTKKRYNDRLLMFLLKHYGQERIGSPDYAHRDQLQTDFSLDDTALGTPVAALIDGLEPQCPADPHKLMHPDDFKNLLLNEKEEEAFYQSVGQNLQNRE